MKARKELTTLNNLFRGEAPSSVPVGRKRRVKAPFFIIYDFSLPRSEVLVLFVLFMDNSIDSPALARERDKPSPCLGL